jgi:uncharacterized integral membrane protein (TIGR00697 family)
MSQNDALGKATSDTNPSIDIPLGTITLIGLFITALATAQIISSKLLAITLPLVGLVAMPGGTLAYAFTFIATDALNELYGERVARQTVNVAFGMNFVMLALVYTTIHWPHAGGVPQPMFSGALSPAANITMGSLGAFLASQHLDVHIFSRIRESTSGKYLWLRNIGSTAVSQGVDTVLFTVLAFVVAPVVFGVGSALPFGVVVGLVVGQYVVKALIAVIDTPIVYGIVRVMR